MGAGQLFTVAAPDLLRLSPPSTVLILVAGALAWRGGDARAGSNDEPNSVGDRFIYMNRPPGAIVDGWQVRPSVTLRGGYDDNITLSRGSGPSSSEVGLAGAIDAERDAGPYELNLGAWLGQTWYPDSSENDATEANVSAAIALDLKPELLLRGSVSFLQAVERGIDNGIFVDGVFQPYSTRAEYRRVPLELSADYRVGGLELLGSAQIASVDYDAQATQSGLTVPQNFRNGWESEVRFRTGYDLNANLSLFGEAATTAHRYDDPQGDRDSWRVTAGTELKFSRLLVGEASVGYAQMSLGNGGQTSGLTYGARLHWFISELMSLTLDAARRFDGEVVTTAFGVTSAAPTTQDVISVRAEWEPLRALLVHAQAGYEQRTHESSGRMDDLGSVTVGATYVLTSSLRVEGSGTYESGTSDSNSIERHSVSLGLTVVY